jgi:hypothetical protein
MMMRWHVRAWGSNVYPDIDEMWPDLPSGLAAANLQVSIIMALLSWKYPYVNIAALDPVSREALD